jgi:3,4-dihydroxy-9,10-secoandrosta-1,3,5(10)-triene-9,17-dione 4,5-dioxygenase
MPASARSGDWLGNDRHGFGDADDRHQGLRCIVAECADPGRCRTFGAEVLGAMVYDEPDGCVRLKIDERPFRLLAVRGESDRYLASGWEVAHM